MHSDRLVIVARLPDAMSAYALRNELRSAGVPAVVEGAESGTALGYVGSALGGVKVLVPQDELEAARKILAEDSRAEEISEWECPKCHTQVDAGFAVCWRCGTEYPGASNGPKTSDPRPSGTDVQEFHRSFSQGAITDATVPASPLSLATAEAGIESAWRAAVVGTLVLPVITHLYSLVLLAYYTRMFTFIPESSRQRCYAAAAIDLVALAVVALLLRAWS